MSKLGQKPFLLGTPGGQPLEGVPPEMAGEMARVWQAIRQQAQVLGALKQDAAVEDDDEDVPPMDAGYLLARRLEREIGTIKRQLSDANFKLNQHIWQFEVYAVHPDYLECYPISGTPRIYPTPLTHEFARGTELVKIAKPYTLRETIQSLNIGGSGRWRVWYDYPWVTDGDFIPLQVHWVDLNVDGRHWVPWPSFDQPVDEFDEFYFDQPIMEYDHWQTRDVYGPSSNDPADRFPTAPTGTGQFVRTDLLSPAYYENGDIIYAASFPGMGIKVHAGPYHYVGAGTGGPTTSTSTTTTTTSTSTTTSTTTGEPTTSTAEPTTTTAEPTTTTTTAEPTTTTTTTSTTTAAPACTLEAAIYERQLAAGIPTEQLIDPEGEGTYTLAELTAYINGCAVNFISDNAWDGGASAPTAHPATYADAATDRSELATLVLALQKTLHVLLWESSQRWRGNGTSTVSYDEAKTAAEASFAYYDASASQAYADMRLFINVEGKLAASKFVRTGRLAISGLSTAMAKTVHYYAYAYKSGSVTFDNFGYAVVPAENTWGLLSSDSAGTAAASELDDVLTASPESFPAAGGWPASTGIHNMHMDDPYAVIEWTFTCTDIDPL